MAAEIRPLSFFFFSSRRRHTRCSRDWSSDVCSSDLASSSCRDLRQTQKSPPPPTGTPAREGPRGSCKRAGVWQVRACRRPKKPRESRRRARVARRVSPPPCLLQFDDRALCFELLFDLFGFLLGHAFLHRAGRAFHQVLGLLQAQAGDRPDFLDDLNLLLPATLEDDRELGLLLGRRGRGCST